MRAYDIAGKRGGLGITQIEYGKRLGWAQEVVRAVETGQVDISPEQYRVLDDLLDTMAAEKAGNQKGEAVEV